MQLALPGKLSRVEGIETLDQLIGFGAELLCFPLLPVRPLPAPILFRCAISRECCQLAARLRKCVEDVGNVFRAELKLPGGESQP